MQESLKETLARIELEVKELNREIFILKNSSDKSKQTDLKSEIESVVTESFISNLYRNK